MSITKLRANYTDGIVRGKRKYTITVISGNTVTINDVSEFIKPELNVTASEFNNVNVTVNTLIDLAESNDTRIEDVSADVTDLLDGETEASNASTALTASHASNATRTTLADSANSAQRAINALSVASATTATTASSVANEFILLNKAPLIFVNKQCLMSDARITANSLANLYYSDSTSKANAKDADLTIIPQNGSILITAVKNPNTIRASIKVKVV